MLATNLLRASGGGLTGIFGSNPGALDGVDFYDGTPAAGMIVFKTPGTYSVTPSEEGTVDKIFLAGAGGGGGRGGGGGGYTQENSNVALSTIAYAVVVGAKGVGGSSAAAGTDGGYSRFGPDSTYQGNGGIGSKPDASNNGGAGGSGGGALNHSTTNIQGHGGTDGSNGISSLGTGGTGQGTTTTFAGYKYSGGGGGGNIGGSNGPGNGGADGGGNGAQSTNQGEDDDITAGGGGCESNTASYAGDGGQGIVVITWGGYSQNYNPVTDVVS